MPSEMERVLSELEWQAPQLLLAGEERGAAMCAAAAGLLREMAADFERYADHPINCDASDYWAKTKRKPCSCGLDAARERWRLSSPQNKEPM